MKFTVDAAHWASCLQKCASVLSAGNVGGVATGCVRVVAGDGKVGLTGTDGSLRLELDFPCQVAAPGVAFVPGPQAAAQAARLSGDVAVEADGTSLLMRAADSAQAVAVVPLPDAAYPRGDQGLGERAAFTAPAAALAHLVRHAEVATGDYTEVVKSGSVEGVVFDFLAVDAGHELGLLGLDGRRGVFSRFPLPAGAAQLPQERLVVTMASRGVKAFLDALKGLEGDVRVVFTAGLGRVEAERLCLTFPLTNFATAIPWRDSETLLPAKGLASCALEAKDFQKAVAAATACLSLDKESSWATRLTYGPGQVALHCRSKAGEGNAACAAKDSRGQEGFSQRVSGAYLTQHLKAFGEGPLALVANGHKLVLTRDNTRVAIASLHNEGAS